MSPQDNSEISDKLNALHTALLGIPGTEEKGFIGDVKALLDKHENRITAVEGFVKEQKGAARVIHYGITVIVSGVTGLAARYFGR